MEAKAQQTTKNYPRIYRSSNSEDEIKLIGLLEKEPATKIAPLCVKVQIRHDNGASGALFDRVASKSITNATTVSANIKHQNKVAPLSTTFKTVGSDVTSSGSTMVYFSSPSSTLRLQSLMALK